MARDSAIGTAACAPAERIAKRHALAAPRRRDCNIHALHPCAALVCGHGMQAAFRFRSTQRGDV